MKALSVKQPWANLIAEGKKTIETRTWSTKYRGPLLIISSLHPKIDPYGYIIAIVDIIDCRLMIKEDEKAACCEIYPNAYVWILNNIRKVQPIPYKGRLGIFECKIDELELMKI